MERGYNVLPQHQVGAYYIDLVVVGNGRRLAIECDGEQFHGPEKLQEDLEREAILMRRGWTFERIRGSLFFRDEDRALESVFHRLEDLGIAPELNTNPSSMPKHEEILDRVIRRAQEVRNLWNSEQEDAG